MKDTGTSLEVAHRFRWKGWHRPVIEHAVLVSAVLVRFRIQLVEPHEGDRDVVGLTLWKQIGLASTHDQATGGRESERCRAALTEGAGEVRLIDLVLLVQAEDGPRYLGSCQTDSE